MTGYSIRTSPTVKVKLWYSLFNNYEYASLSLVLSCQSPRRWQSSVKSTSPKKTAKILIGTLDNIPWKQEFIRARIVFLKLFLPLPDILSHSERTKLMFTLTGLFDDTGGLMLVLILLFDFLSAGRAMLVCRCM